MCVCGLVNNPDLTHMKNASEDPVKMATCILKVDHSSLSYLVRVSFRMDADLTVKMHLWAVVAGAIQRGQLIR